MCVTTSYYLRKFTQIVVQVESRSTGKLGDALVDSFA